MWESGKWLSPPRPDSMFVRKKLVAGPNCRRSTPLHAVLLIKVTETDCVATHRKVPFAF